MKSALLVIDMIVGMEEFIAKNRINKIIPNIKKLTEKARKKKIPIIYIVHTPLGKKGIKIYSEITSKKGDIKVRKKEFSSFYKTNLDKILKQKKIKRLIITGMSTQWCVQSTTLDAHYRKYKTVLVSDAVMAPTVRDHEQALDWMKNSLENFSIKKTKSVRF